MSSKSQPNLTEDLIKELYEKKELKNKIQDECDILTNKIKHEMSLANRKEFVCGKYKVKLETKYEPNDSFYKIVKDNNLEFYLKENISPSNLKKVTRKLSISDAELYAKFMTEKKTKWLYIDKF